MLKKLLTRHEGYRLKPYRCIHGYLSIGIGHNIDANGLPDDIQAYLEEYGEITEVMVDILFESDIQVSIDDCHKLYPDFDNFTENRQAALIDFVFNVGYVTARKFKNTNRAINEGRWDAAAELLRKSLYWKQLGGDPPGTDDGKLERPEVVYQMFKEG